MITDGLHDVPPGKVAMVVTHLEMRRPASTRPASLPDGLRMEQLPADTARYRRLFDRVGRDWLWYGRRLLDDDALSRILANPAVSIFTLRRGDEDLALLELDFRKDRACELAYFGLAEPLIGSGAGRYLMNQAISRAWARPIRRFHVHTCTTDSSQALGFYIRSGFVPYRQQIEIDDDPRLKGLLPEGCAPHVPVIPR